VVGSFATFFIAVSSYCECERDFLDGHDSKDRMGNPTVADGFGAAFSVGIFQMMIVELNLDKKEYN